MFYFCIQIKYLVQGIIQNTMYNKWLVEWETGPIYYIWFTSEYGLYSLKWSNLLRHACFLSDQASDENGHSFVPIPKITARLLCTGPRHSSPQMTTPALFQINKLQLSQGRPLTAVFSSTEVWRSTFRDAHSPSWFLQFLPVNPQLTMEMQISPLSICPIAPAMFQVTLHWFFPPRTLLCQVDPWQVLSLPSTPCSYVPIPTRPTQTFQLTMVTACLLPTRAISRTPNSYYFSPLSFLHSTLPFKKECN